MINTVLGEIRPEQLGRTYMHEHIYADLSGQRNDPDSQLTDMELTLQEIDAGIREGIQTFVDVTCIGMGRSVKNLAHISRESGAHIVCATGYYLPQYYPDYVLTKSSDYLADMMIDEIVNGIDGSGIKAGIIGEIAAEKNNFSELNKKVFQAAAIAHQKTGLAVTTHCSSGTCSLEQAEFLINEGVDKTKIILGHMDLCMDGDELRKVLDLGVTIGFDTIGKTQYVPDETRLSQLASLCGEGYADRIILSEDISRKSYYKAAGGKGYGYLMNDFLPKLRQKGVSEEHIQQMLIKNPRRLLDVKQETEETSDRMQILLNAGAVSKEDLDLCNGYIQYLNQSHPIDPNHFNYEKLETHLVFSFKRLRENTPITEFPDHLKEEVEGTWFCELALKSFREFCESKNIAFVEAEAKYISIHLAVMI